MMAVDVQLGQQPSAGVPRKLFQLDRMFNPVGYDVSADGRRFLVVGVRPLEFQNTPITVVLNWWVEFAKRKD